MRKVKFTKEEEALFLSHGQPKCPGKIRAGRVLVECGSYKTGVMGGTPGCLGFICCYRCGHEWGWVNRKGQAITRKEYVAIVEKEKEDWRNDCGKRLPQSYGPGYTEELEMAKKSGRSVSKKSGSKSKRSVSKGNAKKVTRTPVKELPPEERSKRSAIARTAFLMHTTTKTNEDVQKQILKEFKDAGDGHINGSYQTIIRSRLQKGNTAFAWLASVAHKGDSYFGHGPKKAPKKVMKKTAKKAKKAKKSRSVSG